VGENIARNTVGRRVHRLVALPLALVLPTLHGVSHAQGQDSDEAAVDEIVVIGTHIRQVDPDGPSPVTIIDRDALDRTGAPTVGQALERSPFGGSGSFNDSDALSTAIGGSGVSFRGLGANAVLVLINGRRVTPYGFSFEGDTLVSFVDLNSIPIGAVERIEILRDGASAIYGSDAIAGVVNIVLKEDVSGMEIDGRIGRTADSGAEEVAVNALWGHVGTRTSVQVIASYSDREQLLWRNREISKSGDFRDIGGMDFRAGESANFQINGTWATYGAECEQREGTVAGIQDFELLEGGFCVYDQNTAIAEPSIERIGVMSIVNHDLRDDLTLHVEASYQDSEILNQTAPELFIGDYFPLNNPWNPFPPSVIDTGAFGEPLLPYAYAFVETGPAIDDVNSETIRGVVSLEGIRGRWVWEIGTFYNQSKTSRHAKRGYLAAANIDAAMNGVDLNGDGTLQADEYWNPYSSASNPNSQALANTLHAPMFRESRTELFSVDGLISGKLMELPSGNLSGALGFEWRDDSLHDVSDQVALDEQLANQNPPLFWGFRFDSEEEVEPVSFSVQQLDESFSPTAIGSRRQYSIYGELQIPILENLDVQAALRYENYSDFGSDINPRIAMRYKPWSRLTLRGSWGQSFRAPSLAELNLGASAEMYAAVDVEPCLALNFLNPPFVGCLVESFEYVTSGNQNLKPEESESLSIGFTADIWRGLSVSANYWSIEHKDRIVSPGIDLILANEQVLGSDFVVRNPPDAEEIAAGAPGNIERVNNLFINLAKHNVSGYDVDANIELEIDAIGTLNSRLLWTILDSSEFAFNASDPLQELAGSYGHPENRASLDTYLSTDSWVFGVFGRWTDGYDDPNLEKGVASQTEWDAQISNYSFDNIRITLGVINMFDEPPPFSIGAFNAQGFNTQLHNMRGRTVYGRITVTL